jgi:hypothetical protein
MQIRNHLGTRFGIWKQRHAWFWFIDDPRCESAAVGVAANGLSARVVAESEMGSCVEAPRCWQAQLD